ncbi:M14 family zinc carboxypeptidase [Winogradskyella sp.]|uniref:M14 family zinc carboxypeptidase n=1 Tax=Winogradskyella sp. TaxID=1883156 RepID=UPI003F6AE79F
MELDYLNKLYKSNKVNEVFGRYITNNHLENFIKSHPEFTFITIGKSVKNNPIYGIKIGAGNKKVLLWSQMHGNEPTTTKAILDCLSLFSLDEDVKKEILSACTLFIIPILNPDGAYNYTRFNANDVDLNRDALHLSQPESKVLRSVFNDFKPDFCFNLHGQRTIYNVGKTKNSATLAFLSPSENEERSLTDTRKVAMSIIAEVNDLLQKEIPESVARYDDSFNLNCVGDMFQSLEVPTLLYEAGHCNNDYQREEVRRLVFFAILKGLKTIATNYDVSNYKRYLEIPENNKKFHDIIIRNARVDLNSSDLQDIAIQYKEVLIEKNIVFIPQIVKISSLDEFYGHREIDAKGNIVKSTENLELKLANENDFVLINNEKISLKPLNY